jgi:UDP-GlcNAc:undecaprenyl-phosphate GlcNAc-1-phosphate transferase
LFESAGYSHRFSLIVISAGASILAALGCLAEVYAVAEWIMLVCFLLFFMCYSALTQHAWKKLTQI